MSVWGLGNEFLLLWVGVGLLQPLQSWVGQSYSACTCQVHSASPGPWLGLGIREWLSTVNALGISPCGTDMFGTPRPSLPDICHT